MSDLVGISYIYIGCSVGFKGGSSVDEDCEKIIWNLIGGGEMKERRKIL